MAPSYRVVSCDGGGIRGLTSALLLQDLQSEFGILDNVDLVAGNSIGGITAVLLQGGTSIDEIVEIYRTECCTIFTPYQPPELKAPRTIVPDEKLSHLMSAEMYVIYESSGLKSILERHLDQRRLGEIRPVFVPSVRLAPSPVTDPRTPLWQAVSFHNLPGSNHEQVLAVDAAMCTSAAPVYFPPYDVEALGSSFADGFVYADNPSLAAMLAVMGAGVLSERGSSLEDARLLSLGTGLYPASIPPENIGDPFSWGFTRWLTQKPNPPTPALPFITMVPNLNGEAAAEQAAQLMGARQLRVDVPFQQMIGIDACTEIPKLVAQTEAYMQTPQWAQQKQWVEENFV